MPPKRKLAIWLAWANFSEYYSRQLAAVIAPEWETTVTYHPLDWSEFDVVMPFFPGPNRNPDCPREKIVKFVWEPHEFGWAQDAGTVCAASMSVYERIVKRYGARTQYLPWGVNPEHFYPQPQPQEPLPVAGWCGQYKNPRKQYPRLEQEMADISQAVRFYPNLSQTEGGRQTGKYTLEEMHEYYRQINVYVCASASEGFGFPLLEAAACGRAVVTFDVGCARDLEHTGAGVVIVKDWEELRRVVQELNIFRIAYEMLGGASAAAVQRAWTWPVLKPRWLEVLNDAG